MIADVVADAVLLRLPLGNDAVAAALAGAQREFGTWEPVSRGTDFDE